jgi:hypothetical protein
MVSSGDQLLADQIGWSVTADSTSFIQDLFDQAPVCKYDSCGRANLEAKNAAIGFGPMRKSGASISVGFRRVGSCAIFTVETVSLLEVGVYCQ